MATKTPAKKKPVATVKATAKVTAKAEKPASKSKPAEVVVVEKSISMAVSPLAAKPKESPKEREDRERRRQVLQQMLMRKRQEIIKEIEGSLGQSWFLSYATNEKIIFSIIAPKFDSMD